MPLGKIMPAVSVIIPTYNRAKLLGRAIQSILAQTYQDFELIIVDDGSTDDTESLVKSFNSEKIRYIRHKKNRGASAARNTGIRSAKGEYIALQDSDDEWMPEKLEKQMRAFATAPPEVGVVYTGFYIIANNKKKYMPSASITPKDGNIFSSIIKGEYLVSPQTIVVKRECFERAGMFDEHFPAMEDWEMSLRLSRHYHFKYINEPLVLYSLQPDSISRNKSALTKSYKMILERYFEDIRQDKRLLAKHYLRLGHFLYSNGELRQGKDYFARSIKAYPLHIKAIGAFLSSCLGANLYNMLARRYWRS
jgi:glycosyltransferase involved in cell wall biosynthesis